MSKTKSGFTLVELLIVIVVIAILAAITLVAYNGVQAKARDSSRQSSVSTIAKALEVYYIDNGQYPIALCSSSCTINGGWSDTNDGSWQNLVNQLVPKYVSSLPTDPVPTMGSNPVSSAGSYGFAYFTNAYSGVPSYCGTTSPRQMYLLVYTLESGSQQNTLNGSCSTNVLGPYGGRSNYRVSKVGL